MVFYFLISCHMLVCCEVGLEHHSYIPPRNISIYSLSMTSDTSNCGGFCRPSSYWLLHWIALFIAFFASCKDPNLQLVVFSVVNKIWRVMIHCACILYSNANTNIIHESWGSFRLLFGTLSYQSTFNPFN